MNFALINGIALHYEQEGQADGIPLVFINSLGMDLRIWDTLVASFAESRAIVRYDKRGHGLSDCPPAPYTLRDHSSDLVGLLDYLHIKQASFVGISVGGMIALDFTSVYPERVKALVLCDTAAKIGTEAMWSERIVTLRQRGIEPLVDGIIARWFTASFQTQSPAAYHGYRNMLARTVIDGYIGTCAALRDADLTAQVPSIQAKSLVLCGAEDASTPPDLVQSLANSLPDHRFHLIAGAGHLPCIEQPLLVADTIGQFLKENGYV